MRIAELLVCLLVIVGAIVMLGWWALMGLAGAIKGDDDA